ncbi:HlyD family type I secretion periplasmic adaptor subunit [Robiginitomaculum antarcticum]|uniref:HlyD family type I secretion periplasmic adaptor subunit n=1 Tax=Robiginitomaculum antarcticum TaxID=437507 RepID=UPI000373C726|nr:HlyD family type I secretion periplasmic adaptor subunit [Robiginitomaculum antarcticum]
MNATGQGEGQAPGAHSGRGPALSGGNSTMPFDRYIKLGFIIVFLLFFCGGLWAFTAKIQGAIIAPGSVVVEGRPKIIQHLDGGLVGEILVENGDQVKAGNVLMRLDPTALTANQSLVQNRYYEAQALRVRLVAERDEKKDIDWNVVFPVEDRNEIIAKAIADQEQLFQTRLRAYSGQTDQLQQRIAQARDQINGYEARIVTQKEQAKLVNEEANAFRELNRRGQGYKIRINQLEREFARLQGEINSSKSEIARIKNLIGETRIEILQVNRTRQEQVLTELRTTESLESDLREQLITADDQTQRIDIISPVDGIVHNMSVTTVGGVITPANPIMEIIPINDRLVIETQVDPVSIDQVYIGQATTVRLSAFNQRTTPELDGKVQNISASTMVDQYTGIPYYVVRVEIPQAQLARLNGLTLIPGMPAEAFIQTDERTVWNYLLKPATDQFNRAFREE